jgi:tetratricopeptide (TPR) repeat protein
MGGCGQEKKRNCQVPEKMTTPLRFGEIEKELSDYAPLKKEAEEPVPAREVRKSEFWSDLSAELLVVAVTTAALIWAPKLFGYTYCGKYIHKCSEYWISRDESIAINSKGVELMHQEQYNEAAEQFQKAVSLKENVHTYHYNLGCAYLLAGKREEAEKEISLALKLNPDFEDAKKTLESYFEK